MTQKVNTKQKRVQEIFQCVIKKLRELVTNFIREFSSEKYS